MSGQEFSIDRKIYYHHTDAGGVVYYADYLKMLEEARTEFCLQRGLDCAEWFKKGIAFVVVHCGIDYLKAAQYADTVAVTAKIKKLGNSSIHFEQEIVRQNTVLVKASVVWACVSRDFKTQTLPGRIRALLT